MKGDHTRFGTGLSLPQLLKIGRTHNTFVSSRLTCMFEIQGVKTALACTNRVKRGGYTKRQITCLSPRIISEKYQSTATPFFPDLTTEGLLQKGPREHRAYYVRAKRGDERALSQMLRHEVGTVIPS